jgi:hypothetical protein
MKCIFRFAIIGTILFTSNTIINAQVKVGDNISNVNPNSVLELESTNKGLLLPRLTTAQINAMTNVPKGMLLFNITDSALYVKRDSGWAILSMAAGNNANQPWVYNGSNIYNNNNVGIGTNNPKAKLHVQDSSVVFAATAELVGPPGNPPISGVGRRMMWYADKAAFRVGYAENTEWDKNNIGSFSFATGSHTLASQPYSFAAGVNSFATGTTSFATGGDSKAMGDYSLSAGNGTVAQSYAGMAIGVYNDTASNGINLTTRNATNRLFQIGNGSFGFRSNALTVLQNGNMGIGTTTPLAKLHVVDSSVVFAAAGLVGISDYGNTPISGGGRRMMWYADKAAFRAGRVSNANWDKDSIGLFSFATGADTKAKGAFSFASGSQTEALGRHSSAHGEQTIAEGNWSFATGNETNAIAYASAVMGVGTIAKSYAGTVVGYYNDTSDAPHPYNRDNLNRLFQIGNGLNPTDRSNAMTVLQNGNVGIGTTEPKARLHIADSNVVFSGTGSASTNANPPLSGAGKRMMWDVNRAAFRVGNVTGDYWDKTNLGIQSFATGANTMANGSTSFASGSNTEARAALSFVAGSSTIAKSYCGTVIGQYNDTATAGGLDVSAEDNPANRLFQIGNGGYYQRKNAMTVLQSGNVGIGTTTPQQKLEVDGNIRQKNYSINFTVASSGTVNFTWNHNLGYQPIIMTSLEQTGGQNCDYVGVSYAHINNNSLYIFLTNRHPNTSAIGTVRWIVVY